MGASGPRAGLPRPLLAAKPVWTDENRSRIAQAEGPGGLASLFGLAQQIKDVSRAAVCRPKMKLAGQNVQRQWVLGRINRLQLPADRRAALIGLWLAIPFQS